MQAFIRDNFEPFDPTTMLSMESAFHSAWHSLVEAASVLADTTLASQTRETLALRIIEKTQCGEHDAIKLRDDALAYLAKRPPHSSD